MLFEDVARRLIDIEEHEYTLATDDVPYVASCQSRFNNPEIIAVMGDVVRRMWLLKGTRAAIGRKGFDADLKALASATSDEFMEAMSIAGPRESICSASSRPDMPPKIKTALRTLLLSTAGVLECQTDAHRSPTQTRTKRYAHRGLGDTCAPNHINYCTYRDTCV